MKILKDNKDITRPLISKILERITTGQVESFEAYIEMSDDVFTILAEHDQLKALHLATLLQQNVIHDVVMLLSLIMELNNTIKKNHLEVEYMFEGEDKDEETTCDSGCDCCSVCTEGGDQVISEEPQSRT